MLEMNEYESPGKCSSYIHAHMYTQEAYPKLEWIWSIDRSVEAFGFSILSFPFCILDDGVYKYIKHVIIIPYNAELKQKKSSAWWNFNIAIKDIQH